MKLTVLIHRSVTLQTWLRIIRRKISPRKVYQPAGGALDLGMKVIIASKNYRLSSLARSTMPSSSTLLCRDAGSGARGPADANSRARLAAPPRAVEYLGHRWRRPRLAAQHCIEGLGL